MDARRKIKDDRGVWCREGSLQKLFSTAETHIYLGKNDKKERYYLTFPDKQDVIVEIYSALEFDQIRKLYQQQSYIYNETGCVPQPIMYGYDERTERSFYVRNWIHGQTLDAMLDQSESHPIDHLYAAGAHMGLTLRLIHTKIAPKSFVYPDRPRKQRGERREAASGQTENFPNVYKQALVQDINRYMMAKIPGFLRTDLASFLTEHMHFLPDSPCGVIHQNISLDHALMSISGDVRFISNHHWCLGDPYLEIASVLLRCRMASTKFLTGLLDVYFSNEQSGRSFLLVSLYTAAELMRQIIKFSGSAHNYQAICRLAKTIVEDYDHFRRPVPRWYKPLPFETAFK